MKIKDETSAKATSPKLSPDRAPPPGTTPSVTPSVTDSVNDSVNQTVNASMSESFYSVAASESGRATGKPDASPLLPSGGNSVILASFRGSPSAISDMVGSLGGCRPVVARSHPARPVHYAR
jgi:hypothetical protein